MAELGAVASHLVPLLTTLNDYPIPQISLACVRDRSDECIVTVSRRKEITYMKTFTIDTDNNITVHASRKAARETGAGVFASEEQLAELIGPDNKRLVEIWNSLPGVKPVTKFANRKVGDRAHLESDSDLGEQAARRRADARTRSDAQPSRSYHRAEPKR